MEQQLNVDGRDIKDASMDELESLWRKAKESERSGSFPRE
jgi:hypothetical protein